MVKPSHFLALVLFAAPLTAQSTNDVSFSIDDQGPTISVLATGTGSSQITAGDILLPGGGVPLLANPVLPAPQMRFTGGALQLVNYASCVGQPPGSGCGVEVDALSYGRDFVLRNDPNVAYTILFSVDEWAVGNGNPGLTAPSVTTEGGTIGDAAGDVFMSIDLPPGPVSFQQSLPNLALIDGDGQTSASGARYPGVGVIEPNMPQLGVPDGGDNVDALDVGPAGDPSADPIFFSLDAAFLDPLEQNPHVGSAQAQGFRGGDVLVHRPAGGVQLYASASALGLDQAGPGKDDLDLLILAENGTPGFQVPAALYQWEGPNPTDMLFFSVRRGSAIIGATDSLQGIPIEEGDILMPPVAGGNGNPGIFIAAEALGLSTTRAGGSSDDINAGDARGPEVFHDCNGNLVEDAKDIGSGTSKDDNENGIPDECEPSGAMACTCSAGAPCSNVDPGAGCANSTGVGALLVGTGSSSWGADDLVLTTTSLPPNKFALTFMGPTLSAPVMLGDGLRCVGAPLFRFPVVPTGAGGSIQLGPGIVADSCAAFGSPGCIDIGETWHMQTWYRENPSISPCGSSSNVSNAWSVTFTY